MSLRLTLDCRSIPTQASPQDGVGWLGAEPRVAAIISLLASVCSSRVPAVLPHDEDPRMRNATSLTLAVTIFCVACGDDSDVMGTDTGPEDDAMMQMPDASRPSDDAGQRQDAGVSEDGDTADGSFQGPTASFTTMGDLRVGEPITFDGSESHGDGLIYHWSFPSGEAGGRETTRVFADATTVEVSLTVVDSDGRTDTATDMLAIAMGAAATGTTDILVQVLDSASDPVADAAITLESTMMGMTDAEGTLSISGVSTGIPVVLTVDADGFAKQVVRTVLPADWIGAVPVPIRLLERRAAIRVEQIEDGATVEGSMGVRLVIPPGAVVDQSGNPISGSVDVYLTSVDVSDEILREAFPGAFSGVGPATNGIRPLASLGTVECLIVPTGGGTARIRPGAEVDLEIPIIAPAITPTELVQLGQMQPAWSLDERTGLWVSEGDGEVVASATSPSGFALRTRAPSTRWWNVDVPFIRPWDLDRPLPGARSRHGLYGECVDTSQNEHLDEHCQPLGVSDTTGPRSLRAEPHAAQQPKPTLSSDLRGRAPGWKRGLRGRCRQRRYRGDHRPGAPGSRRRGHDANATCVA